MIYVQGLLLCGLALLIGGYIVAGFIAMDAEAGAKRAKKAQHAAYRAATKRN